MKKTREWQKPELGVVERRDSGKAMAGSRGGEALYCVGPAPAPVLGGEPGGMRGTRYHIGPAPAKSSK